MHTLLDRRMHLGTAVRRPRAKASDVQNEGEVSKKMFGNFREDVERLGVSAMDFKSRKHVENEKLVSLGMRPIKVPTSVLNRYVHLQSSKTRSC